MSPDVTPQDELGTVEYSLEKRAKLPRERQKRISKRAAAMANEMIAHADSLRVVRKALSKTQTAAPDSHQPRSSLEASGLHLAAMYVANHCAAGPVGDDARWTVEIVRFTPARGISSTSSTTRLPSAMSCRTMCRGMLP